MQSPVKFSNNLKQLKNKFIEDKYTKISALN